MRYDTPIYFQKRAAGEYLPNGDYAEGTVEETKKWANVTDSKTDALTLQYADIRQANCIVRLQRKYTDPFDYVRIGGTIYRSVSSRELREKGTFILAEVQQ